MTEKFEVWVSWEDDELPRELRDYINDHAQEISYRTFTQRVNLDPLREEDHPAMWRISAPDNWSVSFYKSKLPNGDPIYVLDWKGIDHIFVDPERGRIDKQEMVWLAIEPEKS